MDRRTSKILDVLGKRFGDDPKVLQAIHKAIADHYDKLRASDQKAAKDALDALAERYEARMAREAEDAATRHQQALVAIREAREGAVAFTVERVRGVDSDKETKITDIRALIGIVDKRVSSRLDDHNRRINRISEFAVGAPNRSIYLNGTIISGRYSDVNLIAGSGMSITESDNETTHMADVTFTSSGGGSFAVMVPTGTVNGINRSFTFSSAPQIIVLDNGNVMNKVSSDGTVNWTGTTAVTLTQAPNFNIYGF